MAIAFVLYGLFALTFSHFQVKGDGTVYFNLLRRFFGEHPDSAFAYQFGSDVWNWPFFLVGKGLGTVFGFQPKTFHVSFEEISITVATEAAFVLTLYLGWRILRALELPRGPAVLFLTAFGTPLFFYVVFEPASKHAVDTLVLTAATWLTLRLHERQSTRDAVLLGALAGVALNTRYVNVAFFAVVACSFAFKRGRALAEGAATAVAVGLVIYALPALRGISYFVPNYFPKSNAAGRFALGQGEVVASTTNPLNGFDPLIPFKMLFSLHRGLFLWTPLTAFGVVGVLLLLHRTAPGPRRAFLWTLIAASTALLVIHTIWGEWDGGNAFSTRFLTALFPLFLIGVAELWNRLGYAVAPVLVLCVAWSLAIAFTHDIGYDRASGLDGLRRITTVMRLEHDNLLKKADRRADARWGYLWALVVHGEDPQHVHGP